MSNRRLDFECVTIAEVPTRELPEFVTQPNVVSVGETLLHAELRKVNSSFAYLMLSLGEQSVRILVTPQEVDQLEQMGVKVGKGEGGW